MNEAEQNSPRQPASSHHGVIHTAEEATPSGVTSLEPHLIAPTQSDDAGEKNAASGAPKTEAISEEEHPPQSCNAEEEEGSATPEDPPPDEKLAPKIEDELPVCTSPTELAEEAPQPHSDETEAVTDAESKPYDDRKFLTTLEEAPLRSEDAWDEEMESSVKDTKSMAGGAGASKNEDVSPVYAAAVAGGVSSAANKTIVEHHIVTEPKAHNQKTRAARFLDPIFGMSKPVLGMVLLYTLVSTGAWAYLLQNSFALNAQIEELETQVDRLATEVDELETQVDRYAAENEILEENIDEFAELNKQLNASNAEYAAQNARLADSVAKLEEQNDRLNASNEEYARLNAELNDTAKELESQVNELEAAVEEIGETVLEAARQNDELFNETELLQQLNGTLSEQVDAINGVVVDMNGEIARLNDLVDELKTILSFLEEVADEIGESWEDLTTFLEQQISTYRGLLIETLQNTYRQITTSWVCSFRAAFTGEPFVEDANLPIGESAYPDVIAFVESEVLEPLCLDTRDFEAFLALDIGSNVPPVDTTFNQLISAVAEYTTAAMNYYFPDEDGGENGLSEEDWAAAEYTCVNLPEEKKFTFSIA